MMGITIHEQGMTAIAPDAASALWLHGVLSRSGAVYDAVRLPEGTKVEFRAASTRDFAAIKDGVVNGYCQKSLAPQF